MTQDFPDFKHDGLPSIIPIFPLPSALLLPGGHLPLNIFEPRYLAMVDAALASHGRLIGMVQPTEDDQATESQNQPVPGLFSIGCAGRITYFQETSFSAKKKTAGRCTRMAQGYVFYGISSHFPFSVSIVLCPFSCVRVSLVWVCIYV